MKYFVVNFVAVTLSEINEVIRMVHKEYLKCRSAKQVSSLMHGGNLINGPFL